MRRNLDSLPRLKSPNFLQRRSLLPWWVWLAAVMAAYSLALGLSQGRLPHFTAPLALGWPLLAGATDRWLRRHGYQNTLFWPPAAVLLGLSLLTLFRLNPHLGLRQFLWALAGLGLLHLLLLPTALWPLLHRWRALWLGLSLGLTALTFVVGGSPTGAGPHLWLGCCGVFFQPSETLKLTLLLYLAAELDPARLKAQRGIPGHKARLALVALLTVGLPLAQGDLGTALVLAMLSVSLLYLTTGWSWLPLAAVTALGMAGAAGISFVPLVRQRVAAWLHPWADPLGYGYQPIQATLAIARGGLLGRGPGFGTPFRVPLAHSDFIFVALVEELGLFGGLAVLALLLALGRSALEVAAGRSDGFGRLLAGGLGVYYGGQSLLILGGNLRLWPVTGLPLPFLAYGGSALLTAFVGLALLVRLAPQQGPPPPIPWQAWPRPLRHLTLAMALGFLAVAVALLLMGLG